MKNLKTQFVESSNVNEFVRTNKNLFNNAALYAGNRDYIIATIDEEIVGYACLFKQDVSVKLPLINTVTLSNIVVDDNYTNKGIATQMLNEIAISLSMNDKVLRRTDPTTMGKKYTSDKFSKILKNNNINYLTEDTSYIFKILDEHVFLNNNYSRNKKFNIFNKTISFVLKEKGIEHDSTQKDLNLVFKDDISPFDSLELKKKIPKLLDFISISENKKTTLYKN
jgi:hypothetical protein